MADPLSIASGIAGPHHAKTIPAEVSALTDVLLRSEEAAQALEAEEISPNRPTHLSKTIVDDCARELDNLRAELAKPTPTIFWPIKEKSLRKHIEELQRFRSTFSAFLTAQTLATVSATHREVTRLGQHQTQKDLLDWIGNPTDSSTPTPAPLPGTGGWILNTVAFQSWAQGSGPHTHLWCHGPPGVGKSMLASVVLQHLIDNLEDDSLAVLRFFCDFPSRKAQTKEAIWKSLLSQLITQGRPPVLQALDTFRSSLGTTRTISLMELSDALYEACSIQQVILIFDGPDELESPKDIKAILHPFVKAYCRILMTSRDLPEIRAAMPMASILEIAADSDDLKTYVNYQFQEHDMEDILVDHPELEAEVINKANGIFLLGKILVHHLLELSTVKEMRKEIQASPILLEEAFESSLKRIDAQSKSHSTLARRVISWVASAERKLLMSELVHGLATEEGSNVIDSENLPSKKTILKVCGGLVVMNPQDESISMHWRAHISLEETPSSEGAKHATYDLVDILLGSAPHAAAAFQAANYGANIKDVTTRESSFDSMPSGQTAVHFAAFWDLPSQIGSLLERSFDANAVDSQNWTPLHWACFAQRTDAARALVSGGAEIDAKDSVGWTALFWAALRGKTDIVECLLKGGANHLERDKHGWTALRWATARHQEEVVAMLLKHHLRNRHCDPQKSIPGPLRDLTVQDALRYVAKHDHLSHPLQVIQEMGEQVDGNPDDLYTVLADGKADINNLWREGHFDPPVGNVWRTQRKGEHRFNFDGYISHVEGSYGRMAADDWRAGLLHRAIRDENLPAMRLLLGMGVDVNNAKYTRRHLHAAAGRSDPQFAALLLEHGADLEARDHAGMTPLHQAVLNGFEKTAELLLSKGADANALTARARWNSPGQRTPLMLALGLRREESSDCDQMARMIRLLLDHGAEINFRNEHGIGAIHYAAQTRDPVVIQHIIDAGGDSTALDGHGWTTVHHFVYYYDDICVRDDEGSPLPGYAIKNGLELLHRTCGTEYLSRPSTNRNLDGQEARSPINYFRRKSGDQETQVAATPLALALFVEDWEMAHALDQLGARLETNGDLDHALPEAVRALQPAMVELLVRHCAKVTSEWPWPLGLDSIEGMRRDDTITSHTVASFKAILQHLTVASGGVDANSCFAEPLDRLAARGNGTPELAQLALDQGANSYQPNSEGLDAFTIAALNDNVDVLWCFLSYTQEHPNDSHWTRHLDPWEDWKGADDGVVMAQVGKAIRASSPQEASSITNGDTTCNTTHTMDGLLFQAIHNGSSRFTQALLQEHQDMSIVDEHGRHLTQVAAIGGHAAVLDALILGGADMHVLDDDKRNLLHLAAEHGHAQVLALLLSHGLSPEDVDDCGFLPLHWATSGTRTEAIRILLQAYPEGVLAQIRAVPESLKFHFRRYNRHLDPNSESGWALTPLHIAAMYGSLDTVRMLLEAAEASESVDVGALLRARTDAVGCELRNKNGVRETNNAGVTALHVALGTKPLSRTPREMAELLVARGADVAGVADHFTLWDVVQFEESPELWDRLRAGMSVEADGSERVAT
ncbi:hypothetical protein PG997_009997 [Apiospora hydei]|uniref:Nephrocystin 3-like N-terminal domain-containing protein n=1 Tax=Apiospora hydei TaxID=1337664 RepID=A0ABR1VZI4_9PEZI